LSNLIGKSSGFVPKLSVNGGDERIESLDSSEFVAVRSGHLPRLAIDDKRRPWRLLVGWSEGDTAQLEAGGD
jgi:hypothetical protein